MPSFTTWSRLEPQAVGTDVATGYGARVHDPLWMLARQWQLGEFGGQDAGTPIVARWRARVPGNQAGLAGLRLAVETGQHFLRLLAQRTVSANAVMPNAVMPNAVMPNYDAAFVAAYAVAPLSAEQRAGADPETIGFADLVAGRAVDGRRLRQAAGDPASPRLDPALPIAPGDRAEVLLALREWLAWSGSLFSEPDGDAAGEPPGELVARTVPPAPVTFHGMPARRFWELEDARIDLGAPRAGPDDLARMLLVEALSGYGNDWYVIPIEAPVGSLVARHPLVVTDTFGVRTPIPCMSTMDSE